MNCTVIISKSVHFHINFNLIYADQTFTYNYELICCFAFVIQKFIPEMFLAC